MARRPGRAAPPDPPPSEAGAGLDAIRAHGGRDEELRIDAGGFFEEAFMTDRPVTAEESIRLIKKIEQLVRSSREYKTFLTHLRIDLGLDRCSFMPNVDVSDDVGLEFHHAPVSLFALVELVLAHRLAQGHPVTSLTVADEVMQAHYAGLVGLVPLLETVHALVHAGSITVSPHQVHGDWVGLVRAYPLGVTDELLSTLLQFAQVSESQVMASAARLGSAEPRLREGARIPEPAELRLLLMAPARPE